MCFFASLVELLWDNGKGETIQEQIALINIVFIVQSIKVISLDASLPLRRQKYCVSASLSLEEAGGQWGRQWVIMSGMHIYLFTYVYTYTGFPGGARGKEPACQCRRHKRCKFDPWFRKISWRKARHLLQYSCLENPMDRGACGYSPWDCTKPDMTEVT